MTRGPATLVLLALAFAVAAGLSCSDSVAPTDSRSRDGLKFPDGSAGMEAGRTDGLSSRDGSKPSPDGKKTGDGPASTCNAKTPDGIPLNPGCDIDFQANGPSAIGQAKSAQSGTIVWLFTAGKKYWILDPAAAAGKGAFTTGGKDIGTAVQGFQPGCAVKTADGTALNPGCDIDFQANGPAAIGEIVDSQTQKMSWLFTTGKKFWVLDPSAAAGKGAFTVGGKDIGATLQTSFQPACGSKTADGLELNPGCDLNFQAGGPTAIGEFTDPSTKKASWLFTAGKKFWVFDPTASAGKGAFVSGGTDVGAAFAQGLKPGCGAKTSDGLSLNPGCDVSFQANGPTAAGELTDPQSKKPTWIFTAGKKYWLYDPAASAFIAGGQDIGSAVRALAP